MKTHYSSLSQFTDNSTCNRFPVGRSHRLMAAWLFLLALLLGGLSARATSGNWTGLSADSLWSSTGNWDTLSVPGTGDTATFGGGGNGDTTIDLTGGVTVSNILFVSASAAPYTIGAGGAGVQTLTLNVNGGVTMSSTVVSNQVLNANLALPTTGTYNFLNNSANTLTLAGTNSTTSTGIKVFRVDGTGNTTISGPTISGTGTMNLEKTNTGTLTLSGGAAWSGGGVNAYLPGSTLDPVVLRQGTTVITGGNYSSVGEFALGGTIVNGGPGFNAKFVMTGGALTVSSGNWVSVGKGNGVGGVSSDVVLSNGASISTPNISMGFNNGSGLNFAKGSLTLNDNSSVTANGNVYVAESPGADMTMTLNGAACFTNVNSAGVSVGRSGKGTLILNGTGTFYTEGDLVIAYSSAGLTNGVGLNNNALVFVNGGTLKVATSTKRWLQVGRSGSSVSSANATLIVSNGAVMLDQNTDIRFATTAPTWGTNTVTLGGGSITFYATNAAQVGGTGVVDLNQAGGFKCYNTFNLDGGTLTVPQVVSALSSGTRIFNFNGGTLQAATDGVTLMNLGAGNAWANVRNGGAVIDSNGKNVTMAQALLHSTIPGDAATDGGLTKNGAGSLTLTAGNTYTGPTTVNAGTLVLAGANSPQSISVAASAALTVPASPVTQWALASMAVGGASGAALNFIVGSTGQTPLTVGTLTFNSANTINITSGNFVAGSSYPLIAYTTLAGGGSYSLGTVPSGVAGNLSAIGNTIYFNVTGVTNSVWTGVVNGTWDIATTANWTNAAGGNTYVDSSPVQFDDTGLNTTTISNLPATVLKPSSILVTNNTKNYAFITPTNVIAGTASLTKTGTAALTNASANTYTGPTIINKGSVVAGVASVANVSGALGNNSAVTLANDPTAALNLNGFGTQIGSLTGGGPNAGNVVLGSGTLTVGGDNTSPAAYAGNIAGTGGLTKIGAGTLTLSGTNTYTGTTTVSGGTLTYASGMVQTNLATFTVGSAGGSGIMNVNSGSSVSFGSVGCWVGYRTGVGVLNINGGTFSGGGQGGSSEANSLHVGGSDANSASYNGYGTINMTGGIANIGEMAIGHGYGNVTPGSGEVNISGGTMNCAGDVLLGFAGNGRATIRVSGTGTLNVGTTATKWLRFGQWDFTSGEIDITTGANLNLNTGTSIKYNQNNSAGPKVFNQEGGNVTFYSDFASTPGGGGNIDLMYTTGPATNTYNLDGGTLTVPQVFSSQTTGGRNFNFNGGTLKAVTPLTPFFNIGTGTAYANVRNGGAIIDTGGNNITLANALIHSTIAGDNATDGGLTKLGSGTLAITVASTYTGPTAVQGGTLSVTTPVMPPSGNLVVNGGTLALDASSGALLADNVTAGNGALTLTPNLTTNAINASGNLTLNDNATISVSYGSVTANPSNAVILAAGSLTKGTNVVINISGVGLSAGTIPLIKIGSGSLNTNGFTLGTLPPGVSAVLKAGSATELDLQINFAAQFLTWHGANADNSTPLPNWDINTSVNWTNLLNNTLVSYLQYNGNTLGDNVTFGNLGYNTDGTNHVNLSTNVVPATVSFNANTPYRIEGSGGIGGATSLVVTNATSSVYLNTSNSYTGGTAVGGGTLIITNDNALGATSGGIGLAGGVLQLDANVTSSRPITVTANSMLSAPANVTAQFSGVVSGSGSLMKTNDGTVVLIGSNVITGTLAVNGGILQVSGNNNLPAVPLVGNAPGYNGVLDVEGGVFNATYNGGQVYSSSLQINNAAGAAGKMIVNGGTLYVPQQLTIGPATGYGAYEQNGGNFTVGGFIACGGSTNGGVYSQTGGTMTVTNSSVTLGYNSGLTYGVMNLSGTASFNVTNSLNGIWPGEVGNGYINVSGNAAINVYNYGLVLGRGGPAGTGGQSIVNLNGGITTVNFVTNGATSGKVGFNGGTLRANMGGLFTPFVSPTFYNVYSNGAVLDDGGNNVSFTLPLNGADNGSGIADVILGDGMGGGNLGSGYVAPPVVLISDAYGYGSNATATAQIDPASGTVTNIIITCPGQGWSSDDSVLGITFVGGGANPTPPDLYNWDYIPLADGGLTKVGAGTLTMTSSNSYSGPTRVGQGTLVVNPTCQIASSAVTVSNGATFSLSAIGNNALNIGNLNAGVAGTDQTTLNFTLPTGTNPVAPVMNCGTFTIVGTNTISVLGPLVAGTFPLLHHTGGIIGGGYLNPVAKMAHGYSGVISDDVATATIYVTVSGAGGIVWQGYAVDPAATNVWDINLTTNWLTGLNPCTYIEGDKAVFDDTGSGLVLLSNAVTPSSVLITNTATDYTLQGSGRITGTSGLTKSGSGTATVSLTANDYSGVTAINAGTLIVTNGGAIGDSSDVTVANAAGANLTVNANETIGSLAGGGSAGGSVIINNATLVAGQNNKATTFGGTMGGSGAFFHLVGSSTMTVTNVIALDGEFWVGSASNTTPVLNINPGGVVASSNWWVIGRDSSAATVNINGGQLIHFGGGNLTLGTLGVVAPSGTLNLYSGSISNYVGETYVGEGSSAHNFGYYNQYGGTAYLGNFYVGRGASSGNQGVGVANISGGQMTAGNIEVAYGFNNAAAGTNVMTIGAGATVTTTNYVRVGFAGSANMWGFLTNNGTLNIGATALYIAYWDPENGVVTLNTGQINLWNNSRIQMGVQANNSGYGTFNQNGGAVTFYSDSGTTVGGTGALDLGTGGSGLYTYNLNGGTLTVPQILKSGSTNSGVAVFNFNGGTLKAAASSAAFMQGLTNAYVRTGGAIIDTAGNTIAIGQALANNGNDQDGGLTKNGNGALKLNGINTYTNLTTVNAGTLGGSGTIPGRVVVNSGAGLAPGDAAMLTINGNLTLNSGSTNVFAVDGSTPANDNVVCGASVTYGGVLEIVPSGTFTVGQTFNLFTGAGAVNTGNFTSVISTSPSVAFSFTNGVLTVTSAGPGMFTNPTGIQSITMDGANLILTGNNGQAGDAYYLLESTDVALPLSQWSCVATNVLTADGAYTFTGTNVVTPGNGQQFYILSNTNNNP